MTTLTTINGSYALDPSHSQLGFVARHAMVTKVRGAFTEFQGTASGNGADPSSAQVNVTIDASSFTSRNEQRDGHVKSADFLDVENFPTLTFTSTDVAIVDESTLNITGDLTIKGVTQQVTIPFEFQGEATDPFGNSRAGQRRHHPRARDLGDQGRLSLVSPATITRRGRRCTWLHLLPRLWVPAVSETGSWPR